MHTHANHKRTRKCGRCVGKRASYTTLGTKYAPKEERIVQGALLCVLPTNREGQRRGPFLCGRLPAMVASILRWPEHTRLIKKAITEKPTLILSKL